ncbi:copper homeostasis protein CutC [Flavobacterium sp.]|uniref:copper homeostasis protein CutC n=1 Tax=Flavobacterium sp. TaxID=239 RepID=UPI002488DEF5|nr:copper homeostasis protein CutC [Flavobacterium sp.]MDI1318159.1 copper homeostasis protein CutC [Flavobacterium sp.]
MVKNPQLEIACFNLESALIAQQNGADRVELCDEITLGGITPKLEIILKAKEQLTIDLFIMIRPRGGNFVYSVDEFQKMKEDIQTIKKLNVDGFVFGILNLDNTINIEQNKELVQLANPIPCSFHRAFDAVLNPLQALEEIIDCEFQTILTSGNAPDVSQGIHQLELLVQKANNRIVIMPGGGLRSSNGKAIQQKAKAIYFHSSAITDNSEVANPKEIQKLKAILYA